MAKGIVLSISRERTNNVYIHSPADGDSYVKEKKTQKGIFRLSVSVAIPDKCDKANVSAGDACTIYGPEGSGKCIAVSTSTTLEGGSSGTPYTQETVSFIGIQ